MKPKTLQEAIQHYSNEQTCINAVAAMRWPDGKPTCPACAGKEHYYLATQKRWKCKECHKQFSVKLGTIFEDSAIGLDKWLVAIWMLTNCKNGVSSYELHRAIGVTQKSAWFMLHRIRLAMKDILPNKIGGEGECEADETFYGGKVKNMHASRKLQLAQLRGKTVYNETKTIVAGVLDRKAGRVRASVVPNRERVTLDKIVRDFVKFGSTVYTDDHTGYMGLRTRFQHEAINKVNGYVNGHIHTQGIENFWSLLKRGLAGTYICVEPEHLGRYVDEQVFRFNNRKVDDATRFELLLSQVQGKRLTYADLTASQASEATHC
jgi:transposase-like protein